MNEPVFRAVTTTETMGWGGERDVERSPESKNTGTEEHLEEIEPIEDPQGEVLVSLGIEDNPEVMPAEDKENLQEVTDYIKGLLRVKGLSPTRTNYQSALTELKEEMGIEIGVEPSIALDRMGGIVKAWRNLSFVKNPAEKRSLFMKLAKQEDSKAMNKVLLEEMNRREVWL